MRGAPASTPAPKKVSPETEQALAQAEMNFVLGERQEALGFVREALTLHPKLPAALILLAALESTNVRDGEDDKLRAILKRMDVILASDPDCRRGRFHRAALRKRLGDLEGAIDDLREVVAADPDDVDALRELKVCERREREAMSTGKSFSQSAMTPKPGSLLDRLLGK
jgi:tetratricopeptide (TPR) repeat protein